MNDSGQCFAEKKFENYIRHIILLVMSDIYRYGLF